ncbi:MAG: acyl-CoA dehydrogenase family protein [Deltaproteobacteria bacterium]|nr:acyl-CoA dehydrogenase family protein [Deltaproteobacteria bacterium]
MRKGRFLTDLYLGSGNMERLPRYTDLPLRSEVIEIIKNCDQLSKEYPPHHLEQYETVPDALMSKLRQMGFFALTIPESYGGLGLSLGEYLAVVEEIAGRDLALGILSLAHLSIGTKGIVLFGSEEQQNKYLRPAASGEMIFSYALTEPRRGSDARNVETTAILSADGSYYLLNGQKTYITNANYAGGLTVFAQLDAENPGFMGAFVVETGWDGVQVGRNMPKMGLKASSTAAIRFKDVRIPRENLLGQPGEGFKIAMTILNYGRLALGATSAGIMKQSLHDMQRRASKRIQFGVPIDNFELVQEKIVKAAVYSYAASAMTNLTAAILDQEPLAPLAIESSHCKLFGTTRAWDVLYDALQVAGGAGYLTTQPYEKRMRDFRVTTIFEGTTEIHSVYPATLMLRSLSKEMKRNCRHRRDEFFFLVKKMFSPLRLAVTSRDRISRRAVQLIKANARRIEAARPRGADLSKEQLLLSYFVEEAREARARDKRLLVPAREAAHRKVFNSLAH